MALRKKMLFALGITILFLTSTATILSYWSLVHEANKAEIQLMKREASRVSVALSYELARLVTTAHDYATWDDTCAFVQDGNQDYVDSNFVPDTFLNNRFSIVQINGLNGELALSKRFDAASQQEVPPPKNLFDDECLGARLRNIAELKNGLSGIAAIPEGLFLVAVSPIVASDEKGPARGTLLFAVPLDDAELNTLANVADVSLSFLPARDNLTYGPPTTFQSAPEGSLELDIHVLDKDRLAGDLLIRGICGKPLATLRVITPRTLYSEALSLIYFVNLSILAVSLILGMVATVFLDRVFLARLARLSAFIKELRSTKRLSERVSISGTDELAVFANHLNSMLDQLEEDATRRKEAEKERASLEERFRQAQKMEAVGQLAGGVAHDFNNLLQVILGHVDLIRQEPGFGHADQQEITAIREAAEKAAGLTRQLLAFSRRQIIHPENLDINDVIADVLKMIRRVIGEHIEPCFVPGQRLKTVRADKGQIAQILMNLCVNARDAMPNGGRLTIETQDILLDREMAERLPGAVEGPYVRLTVADTGQGMDEETMEHIFEPFFTTKELAHGTGLGLATVYGIVKQHGGLIEVDSREGMGATFHIYLPAVEQPPDTRKVRSLQPPEGGTETILVAEDEEPVLNLTTRILRSAGYTVLTARNGEEALRVFEQNAATIDLAVLDVIMPIMNGRQVMERIQSVHARIRFLFCSGYSEDAIDRNFVIKHGVRLVQKPYARAGLLRAVRETLDAPPVTIV